MSNRRRITSVTSSCRGFRNYSLARGFCFRMTNKIINSLAILAVGGLMFVGSVAAQSTTSNTSGAGPGVVDPGHPRVNQVNRREGRQQKRIGKGIQNGTLTSKQATHLENREPNL